MRGEDRRQGGHRRDAAPPAAQALANRKQARQQRRHGLARERQQPRPQRDRLTGAGGRRPLGPADVAPRRRKKRRRRLDRGAPAILALRDRQPRRADRRGRIDQQDQAQAQAGSEERQPRRGQLGAGDVEARRSIVDVQAGDVRHDGGDVRPDVRRLG
jgi:hypothetical protein